jgi:hypothetical protein
MRSALLMLFAMTCASSEAGGLPNNGGLIGLTNAEIIWAAQTNAWPEALWVYKAMPQEFSDAVISNLMALASFTAKDRTKTPAYLVAEDKKTAFFGQLEGKYKHLAICPTLGYIEYHDPKAEASSQLQPVTDVPDQDETTRLGLRYLRLLGIDRSQLATKPGTSDLDLHWERGTIQYADQKTKNWITLTNEFGVYFRRRIDGINVSGIGLRGGVRISFGNNAAVADLQLCWRNLKPHELRDCVPPDHIVRSLRAGRIPLPSQAGPPAQVRRITIKEATPWYDTKPGDEPEDLVFPKLDIIVRVDSLETTNTVTITCPIFPQTPPKRSSTTNTDRADRRLRGEPSMHAQTYLRGNAQALAWLNGAGPRSIMEPDDQGQFATGSER